MLRDGGLTYVSLFSSAGVGCYGFHQEGYRCVATNELNPRRLEVQKCNEKCEFDSGYIEGDLSDDTVKSRIYEEVRRWANCGNDRVDAVIATPPCQGISVINHKKTNNEVKRNSLVVESVEVVKEIHPRVFVFENVMAFQKAICNAPDGAALPIGDYILDTLGSDYVITGRVLNFMNYGSNSSRTRTLIIGVDRAYRDSIAPLALYPSFRREKTLREVIGDFPELRWGEICPDDFYHAFRTYRKEMRNWIHDLAEGESAFDNDDPAKRPHRIVDGQRVENIRKNRDKYTRQKWDRFPQCVHTRNDQLAAQNTVHPEQDRVFSISELMSLMTVPRDFKWVDMGLDELNALSAKEKRAVYRANETNIRQCLGEAVPTAVMREVAHNVKAALMGASSASVPAKRIIADYELADQGNLLSFVRGNPLGLKTPSLMKVAEMRNGKRAENAAFYTNLFLVNEIVGRLPSFSQDAIRIIEPSVGVGCFLPLLFKRYADVPHVLLYLVDIDQGSIDALEAFLETLDVPANFTINVICGDFLALDFPHRFDLAVGNPPFSKVDRRSSAVQKQLAANVNKNTSTLAELFLEKCLSISDHVALVLNKNVLSSVEFEATRDWLRGMHISDIIDFGRYGFTGVSIETICLMVSPNRKPADTRVYNVKHNRRITQRQSYITDSRYPHYLIYRDSDFDAVAAKLKLGIFSVVRDRQITKSITTHEPSGADTWVLKAKNINEDGSGISHIDGYDAYISSDKLDRLSIAQYVGDESVYLTPNMTYKPRVIKNSGDYAMDGSVAVLVPLEPLELTDRQMAYFASDEYRRFYKIARNLATQSINVDKSSVFFYGALDA